MDSKGIIRVMPDVLANKIAAGEVVQRPSSVVKELVENALDAGAKSVDVIVKASGKELIQVVDDGSGMSAGDALLSFQRHATSKIHSMDDLERIRTLGFRGEALASVAAVSRVELRTKRKSDAAGTVVRVSGGKLQSSGPCSATEGTNVAVRNLFYNVPARRNFLKTAATELRHIVDTVNFLALANPAVSFSLIHNETEMTRVAGSTETDAVERRIAELFGGSVAEALVPVNEATSYLSLTGFVGRPEIYRKGTGDQYLFVNGRVVRSRYLNHAVRTAYGNMLPESAYPFFVLYLELDPRHVDVNVHPTKAEIKFDDEGGVYGFVKAVVKRSLGLADLIPQIDDDSAAPGFMTSVFGRIDRAGANEKDPSFDDRRHDRSQDDRRYEYETTDSWIDSFYGHDEDEGGHVARLERFTEDGQDSLRFWQIDSSYVVTSLRSALLVVDQNRAHQRILYEKAAANLKSRQGFTQQILFPQTIDFGPGDFELLRELMPELRALGFVIEEFGGRSVIVRGIPSDLRESSTSHILGDLLDQYRRNVAGGQMPTDENLARSIARRGAVRHGVRMSTVEMAALVDHLFLCESPFTCPAGQPTMIRISIEELGRRFGRT